MRSIRSLLWYLRKIFSTAMDTTISLLSPFLAPVVSRMARKGVGTEACIKWGCLPMPVHYYSPIPDIEDLERRKIWDKKSDLTGIDFRSDRQIAFLNELGQKFGHECSWPSDATDDPYQFYTENSGFSYGCAASLHSILRHYKPRSVIEIGSGNSSLVISSALSLNKRDAGMDTEYIIVDPYPRIDSSLTCLTRFHEHRVELLNSNFFEKLQRNDVLFIDSGHTVRIGSDINFLILDVLPKLASGVIVHFHDIGLPYEYPKVYATNPKFRMFWTEAYLLQAFLCFNSQFEILLAMAYIMAEHKESYYKAFPLANPDVHKLTSSSFWIQKK